MEEKEKKTFWEKVKGLLKKIIPGKKAATIAMIGAATLGANTHEADAADKITKLNDSYSKQKVVLNVDNKDIVQKINPDTKATYKIKTETKSGINKLDINMEKLNIDGTITKLSTSKSNKIEVVKKEPIKNIKKEDLSNSKIAIQSFKNELAGAPTVQKYFSANINHIINGNMLTTWSSDSLKTKSLKVYNDLVKDTMNPNSLNRAELNNRLVLAIHDALKHGNIDEAEKMAKAYEYSKSLPKQSITVNKQIKSAPKVVKSYNLENNTKTSVLPYDLELNNIKVVKYQDHLKNPKNTIKVTEKNDVIEKQNISTKVNKQKTKKSLNLNNAKQWQNDISKVSSTPVLRQNPTINGINNIIQSVNISKVEKTSQGLKKLTNKNVKEYNGTKYDMDELNDVSQGQMGDFDVNDIIAETLGNTENTKKANSVKVTKQKDGSINTNISNYHVKLGDNINCIADRLAQNKVDKVQLLRMRSHCSDEKQLKEIDNQIKALDKEFAKLSEQKLKEEHELIEYRNNVLKERSEEEER